jgi:arylsulfatase A-like enzyme
MAGPTLRRSRLQSRRSMKAVSGVGALLLLAVGVAPSRAADDTAAKPPNIVLILVDDAGFSDFSAYGGEARMPNVDALARSGVRFASYHTSPLCSPSRAMLLTGVDNHRTGVATIPEVLPPEHRDKPGYSLRLEPGVITVADRLRAAGYRTYAAGKWHLGHGDGDLPDGHGFDRSFVLDASGADNWEQRPYMPYYATADWFEDGEPATLPEDFYSSKFIVDRIIDYLDSDTRQDAPFFAYLAFQAIHIPVQAPREFTDHYEKLYEEGWSTLQERRAKRLRERGLLAESATLPLFHPSLRSWADMPDEERQLLARSMAVHAGMLEAMDHHIGRLVSYLERRGLADETLFVVTSDNGPEPSDPVAQRGFQAWMKMHGYTRRLEDLGERGSFVFIGPQFASATAAPGALFKFYASEGGLRVPLIISGPGVPGGRNVAAFSFVTDITPTLLEYAGVALEGDPEGSAPVIGRSLAAVLSGRAERVYPVDVPVGVEVSGNSAVFRGDYKIVRNRPPFGDGAWHLYDFVRDPGETRDLASERPELFRELRLAYEAYAKDVGVLELPDDYDAQSQVKRNTIEKQIEQHAWVGVLAVLALLSASLVVWRARRRRVSR